MKIFISWSGTRSHNAARALRDWLPDLFNGIETFVSSEDIRRGKRWPIEVSKELESSSLGIVCLTNDNLESPWLLFESGALSKSLKDASLFTLLLGSLKPSDVDGPLSHFQHTVFEKENFYGLIKSIEEARETSLMRDEARLRKTFNLHWPELEDNIAKAMRSSPPPRPDKKPEDMLRNILDVVTTIAKNMPQEASIIESVKKLQVNPSYPAEDARTIRGSSSAATALWLKVLSRVKSSSQETYSFLAGSSPQYNNGSLVVYLENQSALDEFEKDEHQLPLAKIILDEAEKLNIPVYSVDFDVQRS
jgi:hypothetical protein